MRADRYLVSLSDRHSRAHGVRVARMKTGRDVRRRDELEEFIIMARAFAQIGV